MKMGPVISSDDFEGKLSLDWQILNPDPSQYSFDKRPGALTITTQEGALWRGYTGARNLFLVDNPVPGGGDFALTTCLESFRPVADWNEAGLLCYDDQDNYIWWGYGFGQHGVNGSRGRRFVLVSEQNGSPQSESLPFLVDADRVWLRLSKIGDRYHASFSTDGVTFRRIGEEWWENQSPKMLGLIAKNGNGSSAPEIDASFDFFEVRQAVPAEPVEQAGEN